MLSHALALRAGAANETLAAAAVNADPHSRSDITMAIVYRLPAAAAISQVEDARERAEADDVAARRALAVETRAANEALAAAAAARRAAWCATEASQDAAELAHRDAGLREGRGHVAAAAVGGGGGSGGGGGHVRVDAFRGLSDGARRALLADNERLRAEAAARKATEAQTVRTAACFVHAPHLW